MAVPNVNNILFGDAPSYEELLSLLEDIQDYTNVSSQNQLSPGLRVRIKKILEREKEAKLIFRRIRI